MEESKQGCQYILLTSDSMGSHRIQNY